MTTRISITCPSYAINNPADRADILKRAQIWADALGWEVVPSPLLDRYLESGAWLPVADRAADLELAMQHEVVWACRGGYAAVHLMPTLLQAKPSGRPLLIGYSDTTVLHACWALREYGPAVYGSFSDQIHDSRRGQSLFSWLKGEDQSLSSAQEAAAQVLCPGIVGLLCGSFQHENPADYGGPSMGDILADWAERLKVPTLTRLPFGHIEDQFVVPCGVDTELNANTDGTWSLRFFQ